MLELQPETGKVKNHVIEEDSNANGKYRKWSDGTLEMWFNSPFTCAIGTKAGSIYTSGQFTLNFPVASKTKCNIVLTIGAGGAIWGKVYGSANQAFHTICLLLRYGIQQVLIYPITRVERGSDKRYLISHSASIKR